MTNSNNYIPSRPTIWHLSLFVHQSSSIESMEVSITALSASIKMIVVYRIPPNNKNGLKRGSFVQEFVNMLEKISIEPGKLLI